MTHPQDTTSEVVAPAPSSDAGEVKPWPVGYITRFGSFITPGEMSDAYMDYAMPAPLFSLAQLEAVERELKLMETAGIIEVAVRNPSVADYMDHWETRATTAETQLASLTKRVGELEGALERKQDMLETLVSFVHRWTWEKEGNGTTDAERLDAIKHYPPIASRRLTGGERQP